MCDNINENGGLDSGEWHTALLAQIAQNLAVIADVMMTDRKTENNSENPNNCEDLQDWKDRMWAEAIVTEPTISKMEQVGEPQICEWCKFYDGENCFSQEPCKVMLYLKTEPQTDCAWK